MQDENEHLKTWKTLILKFYEFSFEKNSLRMLTIFLCALVSENSYSMFWYHSNRLRNSKLV